MTEKDVAFESLSDESLPPLLKLADAAKAKKLAANATRHTSVVFGQCDLWNPQCICPDCVGDANPWSEQPPDAWGGIGGGGGGDYSSYYPDPSMECLDLSGGDDTSYAACMAAGGFRFINFGKFLRTNCRAFTFYTLNRAIVLSTGSNPVRGGATFYYAKYNGILQGFQEDSGPLPNGLIIADYIKYALAPSVDGVFATEDIDFTNSTGGFMYVSDAKFATINFGIYISSGPWSG